MKKQKSIILTDVDGVLLIYLDAFVLYMKHKGIFPSGPAPQNFDLGPWFGISNDQVMEEIETFNSGHWEFGTLKPHTGAVDAINTLKLHKFSLVAITSCSTAQTTIALRKANLYNVFGDVFDAVHVVDLGVSKRDHLANFEPSFWIEDKFSAAMDGIDYGHDCIIMDRPWNSKESHDKVTRCYSWDEAVDYILKNV